MPQSRHRKSGKARKKPKGTYAAAPVGPQSRKNRTVRIVAIVIVVALALSVVAYIYINREGSLTTTTSGLRYSDIREGTGPTPQFGQKLTVHYIGTLESGKKFDSSYDKGKPMEFQYGVTRMIKGWDEGLRTMKVGGKRRLIVPPTLGYGTTGSPPDIPPNATLVFEIELLDVK